VKTVLPPNTSDDAKGFCRSLRDETEGDPFYDPETDELLENGNVRSKDLPKPVKRAGFQRHEAKSVTVNAWELAEYGDPEKGKGKTKRAKQVNHGPRTRAYLEAHGYTVSKVEKMVVGRGGYAFKVDYLGLWDFEGLKAGHPRLLVQVCGKSGVSAHRRKLCSNELAQDNQRPRIENLRFCLAQGWCCVLLSWEKQENGRYKPTYEIITQRTIDKVLEKRRAA
jgi:hypothetical protein